MMIDVTMSARIRKILIIENQNSVSPNSFTAIRFTLTNATRNSSSMSHCHDCRSNPSVPKNVTQYCPTAESSVMPVRISTSQYVHSANLPAPLPKYMRMKLMNVCWLGSRYISSPIARIMRNMKPPTKM